MGDNKTMVYVAAPFWHESEETRTYRRRKAIEYSERLFHKGIHFYSPLLYSERFKEKKAKENFWISHGLRMVDVCDEVHVLCLEGWEESSGIRGEVERARARGCEIRYIEKHAKISFHGSRTITMEQARPVIEAVLERMQADTVVTHGEPEGVCEHARTIAKEKGLTLECHHLQHWRQAGQFHWRSTAVLENSERAVLLHDGTSKGTSNELELAVKLGVPFEYYKQGSDGKLFLAQSEINDSKDFGAELEAAKLESDVPNAIRKTPEYLRFRNAVLTRDKKKCAFCNATENLCVHHIVPFNKSKAMSLDVSNGQTLCKKCHDGIHGKLQTT